MADVTENETQPGLGGNGGTNEYISHAQLNILVFVIAVVLILIFCALGTLGNIFSFLVLFHHRMRNQTNYILAALSISDTLFLVHSCLFAVLNIYSRSNPIDGAALRAKVYPYLGAYGSIVTARITSLLTVLLCIERFIAVYFPMHAKQICNVKNTCIWILVIYLLTIGMFIPLIFKYEANEIFIPQKNISVTKLEPSEFYKTNKTFFKVYGTLLNIVFRFTPLCILPVLNALIIRTVHRALKLRRKMSENGNDRSRPSLTLSDTIDPQTGLRQTKVKVKQSGVSGDTRITVMLLTVSFVFLFCILPGALSSIATHIWPEYSRLGRARNLYTCISSVTFLLETINSSINFIIYMLLSKRFRVLYKYKFCCANDLDFGNLSESSVKEKFRWSSNRMTNGSKDHRNGIKFTISEIGPLTNGNYKSVRIVSRKVNHLPILADMHRSRSECFQNRCKETNLLPRRMTTSQFPIG